MRKENKPEIRLVLDDVTIELDGVLYKAKAVPRYIRGDVVSMETILVLEKIREGLK